MQLLRQFGAYLINTIPTFDCAKHTSTPVAPTGASASTEIELTDDEEEDVPRAGDIGWNVEPSMKV